MEQLESTETENQAPDMLENIDFGDENVSQDLETENLTPPEEESEKAINQEAVEKRINKLTFEKHEERRKREELESKLAELKAKVEKQEPSEIDIPELPDVYDDEFDKKLLIREEAIKKAAAIKARKDFLNEQQQKEALAVIEKRQAEIMKRVDKMYGGAKDLGIEKEELEKADQAVSKFINNPDLARFILFQDDAALIVKYLAASATELENISRMDPLDASVYIVSKVAPNARKLKPGITSAPDPIDIPKGKGKPQKDPFLDGVVME